MKIRLSLKGKEVKGWGLFYTLTWHLGVGDVGSEGNSQHQAHFQADHFSTRPGLTSTYLACPKTVYPKSNLADPPVPLGPQSHS